MPVRVKGLILKTRIDYVKKTYGEEEWERLLASLSPEASAALSGDVLVSSWYPLSMSVEMLVAIDQMFGKGDLAVCREMGRYSARIALSSVYKSFARENDMHFVNRMTPLIWRQYYDSGEMTTETTKGQACIRIHGFAEPHPALCMGVLGWLEGANEAWGVEDVKVEETTCSARGQECCTFIVTGKNPPRG
jgi:predicted hydrocarbon binding protein